MGLGYVYMDLPYGNKKERMEPESALCWKSEQGRQGLWLYRADKVTLAIKSLHFHQNIHVKQWKWLNLMEKLMESCCFFYEMSFTVPFMCPDAGRVRCAHSDAAAAAAFGFFQLRVNLQV